MGGIGNSSSLTMRHLIDRGLTVIWRGMTETFGPLCMIGHPLPGSRSPQCLFLEMGVKCHLKTFSPLPLEAVLSCDSPAHFSGAGCCPPCCLPTSCYCGATIACGSPTYLPVDWRLCVEMGPEGLLSPGGGRFSTLHLLHCALHSILKHAAWLGSLLVRMRPTHSEATRVGCYLEWAGACRQHPG